MKNKPLKFVLIVLAILSLLLIPKGFIERRVKEHNYIQCMRDGHGQGTCEFLTFKVNE